MRSDMNSLERVTAALTDKPFDRPPISMWRHFYEHEMSADGMAQAMLAFQDEFQWDFVKINPRANYHVEDWGVNLRYSGTSTKSPTVTKFPIIEPNDWDKLDVLDISKGVLGEHLNAIRLITKNVSNDTPCLMTLFTPLSIASRLIKSEEMFISHIREHPDKIHKALEIITETFTKYAEACIEIGVSGMFYATTSWATYDRLTDKEYDIFGKPYDLSLLNALQHASFQILHVCRDNNMLESLIDYPVTAFNWDSQGKGNLSMRNGHQVIKNRAVIGGINSESLLKKSSESIVEDLSHLMDTMGNTGWMIGPGCTYDPQVPTETIRLIRESVN